MNTARPAEAFVHGLDGPVVIVPARVASEPHRTLPSAMLAWTAMRTMDTARARTQAGAAVCVPAAISCTGGGACCGKDLR